jgi:protein-arginine kinase activator protein McsA
MDHDRAELEQRMAQAVADEDFELAARLRDEIKALQPTPDSLF